MVEYVEYNPLDYANLTKSVVQELMGRGPYTPPLQEAFPGAGVYALFYTGEFSPYAPFKSPGALDPIYVGKAVPAGARKGSVSGRDGLGTPLYDRIAEHVRSIDWATNLRREDFLCRFLVVTPLWITMAERFLLEHYRPLWNVSIEGFGLHDPGSGRHAGEISWWDTLHPGRPWATRLRQTKTSAMAGERIQSYLRSRPEPPGDGDE